MTADEYIRALEAVKLLTDLRLEKPKLFRQIRAWHRKKKREQEREKDAVER